MCTAPIVVVSPKKNDNVRGILKTKIIIVKGGPFFLYIVFFS